jgi:hypothetical protein
LATAADATLATSRSTTLVNSSITAGSGCSASTRAQWTRNCSPLDSARNGRSQDGGELNPTDDSSPVTSRIPIDSGNPSRMLRSPGQS